MAKRKKLRSSQGETNDDIQQSINQIEEEISNITNWNDADFIWKRFQQVADSDNSASTQAMWKWKKKLFPKIKPNPPMGIKNLQGQVKTNPDDIKYIDEKEYCHWLRPRPLLPDLQDIDILQDQLFQKRLKIASEIKSAPWTERELDKVLASLKQEKSRYPSGLICDIFQNWRRPEFIHIDPTK